MLLDEGADIHVQNKDGFNCLMMAAQEGRLEIVRLLLNNDAHRRRICISEFVFLKENRRYPSNTMRFPLINAFFVEG